MVDLRDQLRSYAELMDAVAPTLAQLAPDTTRPEILPAAPAPPSRRRWLPVAAALSAAAVVVAAIVAVGLVARSGDDVADTTTTSTTAATTTTIPESQPIVWERLGGDTVVDQGIEGSPFTGPGGVAFVDGLFHMFRNGTVDERLDPQRGNKVGYLVSSDGIAWQEPDPAPLWSDSDVPFGAKFARARSALRDGTGTWRIYFDVGMPVDDGDDATAKTVIGLATAPAPTGPWTVLPEPVLTPTGSGYVASPSVHEVEGGFVMYYVGGPDADSAAIGRATSTDGVTWVTDPRPVLVPSQEWERGSIVLVDAELAGQTWVLFYTGDTRSRRGLATSADGVSFTKYAQNPVIDTTLLPRLSVFDSDVVFTGGRWYVYIENGGTRSNSQIVLLAHDGDLPQP